MVGNDYEDLHLATIHGNISQLRVLFKSSIVDDGTTALILGSVNNKVDCVSELIRHGANPELSRKSGHSQITKILLTSGASANPRTRHDGATPLHAAAQNGHTECVHLILEHRAYILEQNRKGDTRHLPLICDINAQLSDGATPLFLAAQNNHIPVLQALIDAGAEVDLARRVSFNFSMLKDLATPLYIAAQLGHSRVLKLLIRSRANVDAPREDGATALFKASQKGHLSIVQSLLSAGASVGMGGNGETPLHAAVLFGRTRISHLLLLRGADPNCRNKDGFSSLQVAKDAKFCDLSVVLEHFASYNISKSKGKFDQLRNIKNMRVTAPIDASFFRNQNRSWGGSNYKCNHSTAKCVNKAQINTKCSGKQNEAKVLNVPSQAKPYASHSSFTEPIASNDDALNHSENTDNINFVNILTNAPEEEDSTLTSNVIENYAVDVNAKMSSIKCTNLADDCDGNGTLLSVDATINDDDQLYDLYINVPSSAPSVLKHAPWKHPHYDTFLPPSPPSSPNMERNLVVETVKIPSTADFAAAHVGEPNITNTEVSVTPPTNNTTRGIDILHPKRRNKPTLRRQASDAAVTYGGPSRGSLESMSDAVGRGGRPHDDSAVDRLTRSLSTLSAGVTGPGSMATTNEENASASSGGLASSSSCGGGTPRIRLVGLSARQQLPGIAPVRIPSLKRRRSKPAVVVCGGVATTGAPSSPAAVLSNASPHNAHK